MKDIGKVSIIIPVYNGSNYLKEAIDSALNQTYLNKEVIVINDGSDDGGETLAIMNSYGNKIRTYTKENGGISSALNLGIKEMRGDYFSWLSHDDMYLPNKVTNQINKIDEIGDTQAIIYSGYEGIDSNGKWRRSFNPTQQYNLNEKTHPLFPVFRLLVNGCTLLVHRKHFDRAGLFDEKLLTTQDYDMWYKLFRNQKVICSKFNDVLNRSHAEQGSKKDIDYHIKECDELWIRMIEGLTEKELREIDGNAYTFLNGTYKMLKERTLYYRTIDYLEKCVLKEMRNLLLQDHSYNQLIENQEEILGGKAFKKEILNHKQLLKKKKTRIAYYKTQKVGQGGLNKVTNQLIKNLAKEYEVIVLLTNEPGIESYEYSEGVQYIRIVPGGEWQKQIAKLFVVLDIDIFIGSHNYLEYFVRVYEVLKSYGIKCIAWNHEDYFFYMSKPEYKNVREKRDEVYKGLDAVVWINQRSKRAYDIECENGEYIPNIINQEPMQLMRKDGKEPETLIAVGRFEDSIKQIDKLLEVFKIIGEARSKTKLYIVGDISKRSAVPGSKGKTIESKMHELGIQDERVIFTGWVNDVGAYYEKAMVQLSTSIYEGFGLVIPEASAHGVPTVAFANGGSEDMIINGENGYIVESNNIQEMAQRVIGILDNPHEYEMMRSNMYSINDYINFSEERVINKWKKLINRLQGEIDMDIKVSVIMPVYNGSNYLREAIESVLNQTYSNIEILVVNDGSDDQGETRRIALSFGNKVTYYEIKNGGVASALNFGIQRMKGEYFSWLSHDDRYKPNKILDQIKLLTRLGDPYTIIYGGYNLINEQGESYYEVNPHKDWTNEQLSRPLFPVFKGLLNGCTMLIHKDHFSRVGLFNETLRSTQDSDMWFRMFKGAKIWCQNEINVETRIHNERGSLKITTHQQESNYGWIRRMHSVTSAEMIQTLESVEGFYKEIAEALKCFKAYKPAYTEAEMLYQIFKKDKEYYKVSIIMPFYNRISMVVESLKSAINQTYKNIEVYLIDDGSTEDLTELKRVIDQDKRIKYIRQEHLGSSRARNIGIDNSTGEYIAFLDSDDLFLPTKVEKQLQFMLDNYYVFSHTSYQRISKQGSLLKKWDSAQMKGIVFPDIIKMCLVATPTVMVKRSALGTLRFREGVKVSQDICMWIDLAYRYELGGLEEYLTYVRMGDDTTFYNKEKVKQGYYNVLSHLFAQEDYLKEEKVITTFMENFTNLFRGK